MKGMKMSDSKNTTGLVELNRAHYAKAIIDFVKESNRAPIFNSIKVEVSDYERLLGGKLQSLREAYKSNKLSSSIINAFKSNGMEMNILVRDHEYNGIQNLMSIHTFKVSNGRYPALRSKDKNERKLAIVHNNMKLANRGKHSTTMTMYDSYYKLINVLGMTDFFDVGLGGSESTRKTWIQSSNETERTELDIIRDVCKFISKHGKKPNKESRDSYESRLAYRYRRLYRKYREVGFPKKYVSYASDLGYKVF